MKLSEQVIVKPRFARSANVERDLSPAAIDGYMPTGRALDVVARIGRGMLAPSAGRALAITGPHGAGKSSLAVFLNALFSPVDSESHKTASEVLAAADPGAAEVFRNGLSSISPNETGILRAFATANQESVTVTVARALYEGANRTFGSEQNFVPATFELEEAARDLSVREVMDVVRGLCAVQPVVLLIDEFGKNLEAFATSGREGDPYLLQSLAEAAQGESAWPLVLITMQHLAFDEYIQEASAARRREWAKVQGRFQDIPYVETPREAWRLIGAAVETCSGRLATAVSRWYDDNLETFAAAGLRDLWASARSCYPLHPLTVAVLPELCARYGQNERTLFSFMAGAEPLAVPAFLKATPWYVRNPPPLVGLDRVYDYFLDSAGSTTGASATASRWLEIETRIRDTIGLSDGQLRVLKSIGVLNLVSTAGTLRASRRILELATIHMGAAALHSTQLTTLLQSLEKAGLVTYRDFADEYRIWQGSDFDLEGAVTTARRICRGHSLAQLLNQAAPLDPAVAGRHSQRTGVLRIFEQWFSELKQEDLVPPAVEEQWDGRVLYATTTEPPEPVERGIHDKPVIIVVPEDLEAVRNVAIESAALRMALSSAEADDADWVARRELIERTADAEKALRRQVATAWSAEESIWFLSGQRRPLEAQAGLSAALSQAADIAYDATPRVANEMIARRELTSQGAKARRMLLEAFLQNSECERFGIEGYGPERAIYEAVYRATGLHRDENETWVITKPKGKAWANVWTVIQECFREAQEQRVNLSEVAVRLKRPPIGLKDGILPLLLVTALVTHADQIALYEHGSLVLNLDDAIAERLARNPGYFTVKNNATDTTGRRLAIAAIAESLGIANDATRPTFLQVARTLYRELLSLPPFAQQTRHYVSNTAAGVLQAFKTAAEPDSLLFEDLPLRLGCRPFSVASRATKKNADALASSLANVLIELRSAYPALLKDIWQQLSEATKAWGDPERVRAQLMAQATALGERVLEPHLNAFVGALAQPLEGDAWLENIAMVVADGQTPTTWTDDLAARFALRVTDLGGAFRRLQALLYERLAESGDGYTSRRLTLTMPDGRERSQVLVLSEHERATVISKLDPLLDSLAEIFGSRNAAYQALMAHLVTADDDGPRLGEIVEPAAKEA